MTKADLLKNNLIKPETVDFLNSTFESAEYEIFQLAGDASNRQYLRVVHNETSCVLMLWEPFIDDSSYPFLSVLNHFEKNGVKVPKVIAKSPEKGLILLEDLGDLTLERKFWENQNQEQVLPYYKMAIDELIKMHYNCTFSEDKSSTAFSLAFDHEKLLWEMNYGKEHLLKKFCGINFEPRLEKKLDSIFSEICAALDVKVKYICHRDYHSRNIMIKLGQTRIIDFQDARLGPIQYDLVSLIHDSYVNINKDLEKNILEYYLAAAKEFLPGSFSRDEFFHLYRLQILQRCFKACGSFSSFYNMREDVRYLKYLSPTLKKIDSYLLNFPEFKPFQDVIEDNGLLEKDFLKPNEQE